MPSLVVENVDVLPDTTTTTAVETMESSATTVLSDNNNNTTAKPSNNNKRKRAGSSNNHMPPPKKGQMTLQGFFTKKTKPSTKDPSSKNPNSKNNNTMTKPKPESPSVIVISSSSSSINTKSINNKKDDNNTPFDYMQESKRQELLQIVMGKQVACLAITPTTTASSEGCPPPPVTIDDPHSTDTTTTTTPSTTTTTTASSGNNEDGCTIKTDPPTTHSEERNNHEKPEPNRLDFDNEVISTQETTTGIEDEKQEEDTTIKDDDAVTLVAAEAASESSLSIGVQDEEMKEDGITAPLRPTIFTQVDRNNCHEKAERQSPTDHVVDVEKETKPRDHTTPSRMLIEESTETAADSEINQDQDVPMEDETVPESNHNHEKTIDPKNAALLAQHEKLRETYTRRALELLERAKEMEPQHDILEENNNKEQLVFSTSSKDDNDEFPDSAVPLLASIIEGRSDSLSSLARIASDILSERGLATIPTDRIADKIKRLATRKNPIKNPQILRTSTTKPEAAEQTAPAAVPLNVFEDDNPDYLWRWEVTVLEILPEPTIATIKKARTARKKVIAHLNALLKLIATIQEAQVLLTQPSEETAPKLEPILARISQEEEKVLKYEREEEKNRLAAHAKRQKELAKEEARLRKQEEQEKAAEEKRLEKERKKEQALALKQHKAAEKEEQERKERALKEASRKKQEKCLLSFFGNTSGGPQKPSKSHSLSSVHSTAWNGSRTDRVNLSATMTKTFPVDEFRAKITPVHNSSSSSSTINVGRKLPLFPKLSLSARQSRRRRAKRIAVPVYVTVYPDGYDEANPFSQQHQLPYAELRNVQVRNKCKFLSFHEDIRPAYYGTWSKTSHIITGRNPFAKDNDFLDYDVDSEAEWEEGDEDEVGEELGDDKADENEDREMEEADGDDADGWLAPDDEVEEELDEEAKLLLRKKNLEKAEVTKRALSVCYVAPQVGGRPLNVISPETVPKEKMDGFNSIDDALLLIKRLSATEVTNLEVCLDPFPPSEDFDVNQDVVPNAPANSNGQGLSDEQLEVFVRFVHNNTLGSKDKIIDELLKSHKSVTNSRAQALRVLDSVAEKKTGPLHGILWVVKKEVLENLGLTELTDTNVFALDDSKQENMKTIARFIHHCTTSSKDKIVDDLRIKHPSATSSRAEAMRILLSISEKKKHPVSGYYWEVKKEICEELGLKDLPTSVPLRVDSVDNVTDAAEHTTKKTAPATEERKASKKKKNESGEISEKSRLKRPASQNEQAKLLAAFVKKTKK